MQRPIQAKHEQVFHLLADRIRGGDYPAEDVLPSEADIMQELGVSRVTVRRALNALVRDGVIESRQGVGYRIRARNARPLIGIVYGNNNLSPDEPSSYRQVLHLLERSLARRRFTTQLYCVRSYESQRHNDRDDLIAAIRKQSLYGLVVVAWPCPPKEDRRRARSDEELLDLIREHQVPMTGYSDMHQHGMFSVDYGAVGRLGAQHFLDAGRRRIAVIAGDDSVIDQGAVVDGYSVALAGRGVAVRPEWVVRIRELSRAAGYVAMHRLLSLGHRPDAVVIGDDVVASGAMTAVLERGIDVPCELELASLHVTGSDLLFPKPYVQIQIDLDEVTNAVVRRVASSSMFDQMSDPPHLFAPTIVSVASSVPEPSVGDALIVRA